RRLKMFLGRGKSATALRGTWESTMAEALWPVSRGVPVPSIVDAIPSRELSQSGKSCRKALGGNSTSEFTERRDSALRRLQQVTCRIAFVPPGFRLNTMI